MLSLPRMQSLLFAVTVFAILLHTGSSQGQGAKLGNKGVTFKTFDGVELAGTLYPNNGGKRDAVVLLIPNFDLRKGGGIQQDGWSDLAKGLQADGYTVLGFDFRGFGDSKTIDPLVFWNLTNKHNNYVKKRVVAGKLSDKIDHKDFQAHYAQYFVNDIAAAKAFLDRENDRKTCNTSNLIVVGAGQGATLGAMWVANECRRRKDKNPIPVPGAVPMLGDPESKNIAATVWLSITPNVGGRVMPLQRWILEAGKTNKIPMAFVHGKNDATSGNIAVSLNKAIKGAGKNKDFELTGVKEVPDTKLSGHQLLNRGLGLQAWMTKTYLGPVMEKRGVKEWAERKVEPSRFYYTTNSGTIVKVNKPAGTEVPSVDINFIMLPAK